MGFAALVGRTYDCVDHIVDTEKIAVGPQLLRLAGSRQTDLEAGRPGFAKELGNTGKGANQREILLLIKLTLFPRQLVPLGL
jgi:hypothetical protein